GVITLLGKRQSSYIERLIEKEIPANEIIERKIVSSNAAGFQGDERDVIFLSMINTPTTKGSAIIKRKSRIQEYNVAVSRAKDQLWLVHSMQLSDFGFGDLRGKLVGHFYKPKEDIVVSVPPIPPKIRTKNNLPNPFDSWFEVEVYQKLKSRGLTVFPQYKVGKYSIDLVIMLNNGYKLAVECDGDRYHGGDQLQADIERQRLLERVGWEFFRIRGSQFYYDQEAALKELWEIIESRETIEIVAPETPSEEDTATKKEEAKKKLASFKSERK
ncbi:MAG: AAA domain-containing protein, partial [Saprospiraceae bacterium]